MTSISALNLPNGEASTLLMIFGESNKEISLTVKVGMSIEELQVKVSDLLSELMDVPKDIIKKTKVSKKQ